ncbi:MAG: putative rane protein, partial [Acidobacteriota bacterium]
MISDDQRRAILARYRSAFTPAQLVSRTLLWLAVASGGVGMALLLAWNWRAIPSVVKVAAATTLTAGAYGAAALFSRRRKVAECEYAALLAGLLAGGALVVGVEAAGADPLTTPITLWWSGVLAITAAIVPSAVIALAGTAAGVWWLLITGGTREAPWEFLLVWPVLAVAVQRDRNPHAAGGVAFAFGAWSFLLALAAWPGQGADTPVFVTALLTGAWLDALAHSPDGRRPAFARVTPALAVISLAMTMLLPSGSHRAVPDAQLAKANAWLALA